jgi:hypothetical protein
MSVPTAINRQAAPDIFQQTSKKMQSPVEVH